MQQSIRQLVYIGLFSALFIVLGLVQIKLTASAVPISLQTLGLTLTAIFLKPKQAFISVFICIGLGVLGLPIFGGNGGIAHLLKPTGGFIIYFSIGALLISLCINRLIEQKLTFLHRVLLFVIYYGLGALASYLIGIPWAMVVTDSTLAKTLTFAFYPFIVGDLLKALLAVFITIALHPYIIKVRNGMPL